MGGADDMLHITGNKDNLINYLCDCGTKGFCTIKPVNSDAAIVVDIKCPNCFRKRRVTLLQYSSEKNKKNMLNNLNDINFCWSAVLNNEVV